MHEGKKAFVKEEMQILENTNITSSSTVATVTYEERPERRVLVVTCMDERNTTIEEWLQLEPGKESVYFSGGGRISLETLNHIFGKEMRDPSSLAVIYLVAHQCFDNPHAGCAAFANDTAAQKEYFMALRTEIIEKYPNVIVHIVALDTTTGELRGIHSDIRDEEHQTSLIIRSKAGLLVFDKEDEGHAGYGIYIGNAYRAWISDRNKYFSISADNPNIAGDTEIALNVMRGDHSKMDMDTMPVVIIADYPIHEDRARTRAAWDNMERGLEQIKRLEGVQEGIDDGSIRIITCETDVRTWKGKLEKADDST